MRNKIPSLVAAGVALLFGITILAGSFYTVDQGERAVITRNGAVVSEEDPGLHFKLPWIESVTKFEVRTRRISWAKIAAYSKDIQPTYIKLSLNYHVDPAKVREVYSTLGEQYSARVIEPNTLRAVKDVFGKYVATDIINNRDQLGAALTADLGTSLSKYGMVVEVVQLENIDFSDAYEKSVEMRMQAEVDVKKKEQELRSAEVDAQKALAVAQGSANAVKAKADGDSYATTVNAKAEADAIRIKSAALSDNPRVIELTKAQRWNGVLPTTMLPGGAVPMINLGKE